MFPSTVKDVTTSSADLADHAQKLGVVVIEEREAPAARALWKVMDQSGELWWLKHIESSGYARGEIRAMQAFAASGVAPETVVLSDEVLMMRHVPLSEEDPNDPDRLREVGALLRRAHAVTAPPALPEYRELWSNWSPLKSQSAQTLPDEQHRALVVLAERLMAGRTREGEVLLHGDLTPENIMRDHLIDPYGMIGPRGADLAAYAARLQSPREALNHLVEGYGIVPDQVTDWLAFHVLTFSAHHPAWGWTAPRSLRQICEWAQMHAMEAQSRKRTTTRMR